MKHFLIFSAVFSISFAQQLVSLNTFSGNNVQNALKVDAPYNIYVSAHSDDDWTLRNTFIVNGADKISLYDLKNNKFANKYGQLKPYLVPNSAYLITLLATTELAKLTGVIYFSSTEQLSNNNFYVFDIGDAQHLSLQGLGTIDLTILFLNTNMAVAPTSSTKISQWSQNPNARVYIYAGVPYGQIEPKKTQIFSNPMTSDMFEQYIPSVETFSLSMVAFYMRTYNGAPSVFIEPGSANLAGTYTTSFTTTGFYMKPRGVPDAATQINMMRDPKYFGWTGCNVVGYRPTPANVAFSVFDGSESYIHTTAPSDFFDPWSTPHIGGDFVISSTFGKDGVYYLQYFVVQGPLNATTGLPESTVTTPKHVETTTKASGTQFSGVFMMILIFSIAKLL